MCTPSVTLSSLKNEDTGIDISVPRYKEEEAPLGGISILFEITVLTKLDLFKTRLHKSGDVVHFTIYKAYREIEDLYNKLNKKYPKAGLPPVPKASTAGKYTCEERVEALNTFMSAIARCVEICHSSIFTQFIGINSHRLPSFTLPNSESTDGSELNIDNLAQEIKQSRVEKETSNETDELFPKMKNFSTVREQPTLTVKKVDLFEEEMSSHKDNLISSSSKGGLFDDFEDDDLFSSKPLEKEKKNIVEEKPKEIPAVTKKPVIPKQNKETFTDEVDDSEIILHDRKVGEVSLFKEQDLGGFITKDEESLFLVTSPTTTNKKNSLLLSEEVISPDSDQSLNENLDDLLNLEPLPITAAPVKKLDEEAADNSIPEVPKPQPRPRKKSTDQTDASMPPQKPEVMPRKVFLNKPSIPSKPKPAVPPPIAAKPPTLQSKPPPPPKPKVPAKRPSLGENSTTSRDLDAINANEPTENANTPFSNLANDLKELDILKYIEQEEKSVDAELNLFD